MSLSKNAQPSSLAQLPGSSVRKDTIVESNATPIVLRPFLAAAATALTAVP